MIQWIKAHKFESHLIAFTLMILSSIGLYLAVEGEQNWVILLLISIFACGNLIAVIVK